MNTQKRKNLKIFVFVSWFDCRNPDLLLTHRRMTIFCKMYLSLKTSGTVPIFTLPKQYSITPSWIDWSQISYFASVKNTTTFHKAMDTILMDEDLITQKIHAVVQNIDLFDFLTLVPFDTYMYMLQAHLYPSTKVNSSIYSALILP